MEKCTRFALRGRAVCCCVKAAPSIERQTNPDISDCQWPIADLLILSRLKHRQLASGNRQPSVLIFVFVFVVTLFFDNIEFDRIESNYFKLSSTLFTSHNFALVRVQINVNISITLRASSGRHFFFLPPQLSMKGRARPRRREAPQPGKQPGQSTRGRWNLQQSFWSRDPYDLWPKFSCGKHGKAQL